MKTTLSMVALLMLCTFSAQAGDLNDTGTRPDQYSMDQSSSFFTNDFGGGINTIVLNTQFPRQDPQFGRDAAEAAGALVKIGGGLVGFDYTRLCANGDEEGQGECPSGLTPANIGSGAGQWACTRDNVTGRTWEVKTNDGGLQDKDWNYTWYNSIATSNGGNAGTQTPSFDNPTRCGSHLTNCNTEEYIAAVNALNPGTGLCGFTDWRLPSWTELVSLKDYGLLKVWHSSTPMIDIDYFPNTLVYLAIRSYWSGDTSSENTERAGVVFFDWNEATDLKGAALWVRLVRGEP